MKSGLNFLVAAKRCETAELQALALTSALVNVNGCLLHGLSSLYLRSADAWFALERQAQINECQEIESDPRPNILEHQGRWDALKWRAQEFVKSVKQTLKWCMKVNDQRVLPETLIMVFRIFQEMLSSVSRQACASTGEVDIFVREVWLHLSVENDVCGASAQAFESAKACVIMGMYERSRHFGGQLDINRQSGRGTRLRLSLLLPALTEAQP